MWGLNTCKRDAWYIALESCEGYRGESFNGAIRRTTVVTTRNLLFPWEFNPLLIATHEPPGRV